MHGGCVGEVGAAAELAFVVCLVGVPTVRAGFSTGGLKVIMIVAHFIAVLRELRVARGYTQIVPLIRVHTRWAVHRQNTLIRATYFLVIPRW